jgi:hypothetical protein
MGNIICENYYCESLSYKPEWFSESSWNIDYEKNIEKKYKIDKGKFIVNNINNLLLSKKLLVDFNEINKILIPLQFKYKTNNKIQITLYFFNKLLFLKDLHKLDQNGIIHNLPISDEIFYIKLELKNNKIDIFNSIQKKNESKIINSENINCFEIKFENNNSLFKITEEIKSLNDSLYKETYNTLLLHELCLNIHVRTFHENDLLEINIE